MEQVFYYYDSDFGFIYDYNVEQYYSSLSFARSSAIQFAVIMLIFVVFCYFLFFIIYLIKRYFL